MRFSVEKSTPAGSSDGSPAPWSSILSRRLVAVALVSTFALALVSAIPTAIIENPWFTRMTPVYANQYFFWIGTSILGGALIASYLSPGAHGSGVGKGVGGGFLGYLAIGCPICNKLIVGLLGVSGALDYFAPAQPVLGFLGLLLTGFALWYRARDLRRSACPAPRLLQAH